MVGDRNETIVRLNARIHNQREQIAHHHFCAGQQRARIITLEEALNAIIDRAPERDSKWAGMTARDIALYALQTKLAQ